MRFLRSWLCHVSSLKSEQEVPESCVPGLVRGQPVAVSDLDISSALSAYLECYPDEAALLSEPVQLLSEGGDFASRRNFPMHVTAGALLVRGDAGILLVEHRAYGITLQPGVH